MRIKRYVADTAQKAIIQVKQDLGKDALILHSRPFKEGGFLGLFGKKRFEVLAAVDENIERARVNSHFSVVAKKDSAPMTQVNHQVNHQVNPQVNSVVKSEAKPEKSSIIPEIQLLRKELEELRQAVEEVSKRVQAERDESSLAPQESLKRQLEPETSRTHETKQNTTVQKRRLTLPAPAPIKINSRPTVVVLIGPTGVGKTTTIAKLAANFALFEGKSVGLITIDTYRIAAVEQLKTYAEIINLPIEVVYTVGEFKKALSKLGDKDLILVDTAGRSQKNKHHIKELKQFLAGRNPDETHLVLSANTKLDDLLETAEAFQAVSYNRLIITKLDETNELDNIIEFLDKINIPISYVTTGQSVPEDIEVAVSEVFKRFIDREYSHA
ncbi:MAG TPA: flagellar biosynthesis protein FlhF [Firmicutes bacterium]|nr:flagellar biosynthesis protein FlhF [Bacillota bacterium]